MNWASHGLAFSAGFAGGAVVAAGLRRLGWDRSEVLRVVLGVLILALVAYSTAITYRASAEMSRTAECQQRQNQAFTDALLARSDATTRGNAAQRDFLQAVADPGASEEATARAFQRYLAALDEIDASRAQNPLIVVDCG